MNVLDKRFWMMFLPCMIFVLLFGCEQEEEVRSNILEPSFVKTSVDIEPPSQEDAFNVTIDTLVAIIEKRLIAGENLDPEDPDYEEHADNAHDQVLQEETDISLHFLRNTLRSIVRSVHGVTVDEAWDTGLTGEYLYVRNKNPNSTEEQLLDLFTESISQDEGVQRVETYHIIALERLSKKHPILQE